MEEKEMNKTAIKNFAVSARTKLIDTVAQKAYELGIAKNEIKEPEVYEDGFRVNNTLFKKYQMKQRDKLIQKIHEKGYDQVIDEVAYTWFNRFIAIRFMEVNEYLPTGVRLLSSIQPGQMEPDAVGQVLDIADDLELDFELVYRLQDENNTEELFKYILVKQCNKLGEIMQVMFEQIEDYTELLLPDKLLSEGSVVRDLVTMIDEDDWKEQVEIIGWLYQYYISEKKDEVFADLKKNKKITKENIPATTQLFTPKWIVKYMVENSLGRLWLESHPNAELKQQWKYYLGEAEQDPEVQEQLEKLKNKELNPEDIKVLDPCMGSGHILVYAFDVLYKIYQTAGYSEREIPQLILEKNLYGLDIDDRAAQLAYFALMMKGRSYNRRIFRNKIELNVCAIQESNRISNDAFNYFVNGNQSAIYKNIKQKAEYLLDIFKNAREYGSFLKVKQIGFDSIERRIMELQGDEELTDIFSIQCLEILLEIMPSLTKQAKIMSGKYDIVVTNPPYMGIKGMNSHIAKYLHEYYSDSKNDLFAVFMEVGADYLKNNGFLAMINQHSWMFLSSYETLRRNFIKDHQIYNMLHLGTGAFEEINGEVVQSTTFVLRKPNISNYVGTYFRLLDFNDEKLKEQKYIETLKCLREYNYVFKINQKVFFNVPGGCLAYWITQQDLNNFRYNTLLKEIAAPKVGLQTGSNDYFVRLWYEVDIKSIGFGYTSRKSAEKSKLRWFPYNKGGEFRRWYGNCYHVVNWENDGYLIRNFKNEKGKLRSRPQNMQYYFKSCLTWSKVTTGGFATRYVPEGFIFDVAGCSIFATENLNTYLLGLTNSQVSSRILSFLSPTLNYEVGHIGSIPVKLVDVNEEIAQIVKQNVSISKSEWDSFEISWGFKKSPLLTFKDDFTLLKDAFKSWSDFLERQFYQLKTNEEKLNNIFIDIYGLKDISRSEVKEKDVSVSRAVLERDIKSFISYSVGCMFGRYSLDKEGLVYAGGEFNRNRYVTFEANKDNVIPITDDEYFEDDIVSLFIEFVRVTFGTETIEENLDFIANAITRRENETSRQRIRRYFVKEFYKDHVQTYTVNKQKRPIYWLFDSGKNNGFKALIYMHRYDAGTVAKVRTDYLHTLQRKYEAEIARQDMIFESDAPMQEKTKARKTKEKIQKQFLECQQYDQVIAHVANQKKTIDLDDGVKVNYAKFQDVEIPQGEGKKPLKANLLTKI